MWLLLLYFPVVAGLLDNVGLPQTTLERRVQTILEELLRLERDVADLKQSNTFMTIRNNALASEIAILKSKDESIAFFAYLVNDMVNPSTEQTVIFSGVDTNVGNAYDSIHGVFAAPISGIYHFTLVASAYPDVNIQHDLHLFMKKNDGSNPFYLFLDSNTQYYLQRAASSVLHLSKGERVWVEVGHTVGRNKLVGYSVYPGARATHFSGFLIHAD